MPTRTELAAWLAGACVAWGCASPPVPGPTEPATRATTAAAPAPAPSTAATPPVSGAEAQHAAHEPPLASASCDGPEDCPAGQHCVVQALAPLGCSAGPVCCGTYECYDGCHSDADCPACRSKCVAGACRSPTGP